MSFAIGFADAGADVAPVERDHGSDFEIRFADELIEAEVYRPVMQVVGVGGSGGNALGSMAEAGLQGVQLCAVNTDQQALGRSAADVRLAIGAHLTRGLGAGANPEVGQAAALEDEDLLRQMVEGTDLVFVTAGLGGGTGSGAAPVVARLAREQGALVVGVVSRPFAFEGRKRARTAEWAVSELAAHSDTLLVVTNERLMELDAELSFVDAFRRADAVLCRAVRSISELITSDGLVNVDFADVRAVMGAGGRALMGTGTAEGVERATQAAQAATSSALLDDASIEGARGVLVNVAAGPDVKLREIHQAASLIGDKAHDEALIVFGARIDEALRGTIAVTVIATGIGGDEPEILPGARRLASPADEPALVRRGRSASDRARSAG